VVCAVWTPEDDFSFQASSSLRTFERGFERQKSGFSHLGRPPPTHPDCPQNRAGRVSRGNKRRQRASNACTATEALSVAAEEVSMHRSLSPLKLSPLPLSSLSLLFLPCSGQLRRSFIPPPRSYPPLQSHISHTNLLSGDLASSLL
jgi:hypothetical protein